MLQGVDALPVDPAGMTRLGRQTHPAVLNAQRLGDVTLVKHQEEARFRREAVTTGGKRSLDLEGDQGAERGVADIANVCGAM